MAGDLINERIESERRPPVTNRQSAAAGFNIDRSKQKTIIKRKECTLTIEISNYKSRTNKQGRVESLTWEALKDRLRKPKITTESIGEYFDMTNEQRTNIKDVGGFVGGRMKDGVRRKTALENRTLITIDVDEARPEDVENFMIVNDTIFCCYTTHSATEENPRQRWVFPLSRPVTPEEYVVVAREVCSWLGPGVDETTDQPERLMFWPSCAFDGYFQFWECGSILLDPDEILDKADFSEPVVPQNHTFQKVGEGEVLSIEEGERNKKVFSFAASLRGKGLDQDGIRQMVGILNEQHVHPPLTDGELDTICRSVCRSFKPGDSLGSSLRDAWDDFADLGPRGELKKPKKVEPLQGESLASLMARHIEPPKFVVPGMVTVGVTILASPPKYGKSWMCLDLGISVATGTMFMGQQTNKTDSLYFALEDSDHRMQDRCGKIVGGREIPENLIIFWEAKTLNEGFLDHLANYLDTSPLDIGMVIIDTLQLIRGVAGKTEGVYGYDYRELGQLHKFAINRGIALVLVHHLNKGGDNSDYVSRVNGSTGVTGATDSIITLTREARESDRTKMSITGRDVKARTLIVQMDSNYCWILLGEERDVEKKREEDDFYKNPVVQTILRHMDEVEDSALDDEAHAPTNAVWRCTASQLAAEAAREYGGACRDARSVGRELKRLAPLLKEKEGINLDKSRTEDSRTLIFIRAIE